MGEVYRATDTKLGRDVAVKLIAPGLASDEARMASFAREARTLASLNHPNIAAIYGVEDQALVMELVEGPTLAERITRGPIPLDEALAIARQIAEGLSAAHDKGIVHRDLKPGNIKITSDGTVKLLDFGLAKAAAVAAVVQDETATVALSMSSAGMIVGTPGYMAPEQARGQAVDRRADIWAFGVVLYEMLTGQTLFTGETTTDIMAAVVREEPDLTRVPAPVRPMLRRCLAKDPKRRLRDIGDAMLLLEPGGAAPADAPTVSRSRWTYAAWGTSAVLAIALLALAVVHFREAPLPLSPIRFTFDLPEGVTFTQNAPFAVSPDGGKLAFAAVGDDGRPHLWVHEFSTPGPRAVADIQPNPGGLAWSPDSRFIIYPHDQKLKRVDISGGPSQVITDRPGGVVGAAWHPDGTIVYGSAAGVMKVSAAGGTPEPLTQRDPSRGEFHVVFGFLPDGRFLYTRGGPPGTRAVFIGRTDVAPADQDAEPLVATELGATFVPAPAGDDGHLLYLRDATLVAQQFDTGTGRLVGEAAPVAEQVFSFMSATYGAAYVSASQQGTLVYRRGTIAGLARQLAWFSRDGKPLGTVGNRARYNQMKLSPDGTRLVASRTDIDTGNFADLWIDDLTSGTTRRLTFAREADVQPTWSPDGRYVAWAGQRDDRLGLYRKRADGSGDDELLFVLPQTMRGNIAVSDWSVDDFLIFAIGGDIYALPIGAGTDAKRQPIALVDTPAVEFGPDLSPDSRWLAYISNETGPQELFVQPFAPSGRVPGGGGKWMVSSNGTLGLARWRADSRELLFASGDGALMSIAIDAAPVFKSSAPGLLFPLPRPFVVQTPQPGTLADITGDGQRLLLAMPSEESTRPELSVIVHWRPGE